MMTQKRILSKVRDVFRVPLGDGTHAYGHVLGSTLQGFYAVRTDKDVAIDSLVNEAVAFRVQGMKDRIEKGDWPVVGNIEPSDAMNAPIRFGQEKSPGFFLLYEWSPSTGGDTRRASADEVKGLECDVLWDSTFVLERLKMYFRGVPCPYVKLV